MLVTSICTCSTRLSSGSGWIQQLSCSRSAWGLEMLKLAFPGRDPWGGARACWLASALIRWVPPAMYRSCSDCCSHVIKAC